MLSVMTTSVTIGEFSRLTHLSVKALHHYHDIGLLPPAAIDPISGYRRYTVDQVDTAQLVSRLRTLQMPLPQIRTVIETASVSTRDHLLRDHLLRMEEQLDQTRSVVASLRRLLEPAASPLTVEHRHAPAIDVVAIRADVSTDSIMDWCGATFPRLYEGLAAGGVPRGVGPDGATYAEEFFTLNLGEVVAFVPVPPDTGAVPGLERITLPAQRYAVGLHIGTFVDFDRTYGALGQYVAEHGGSAPAPIREHYLVGPDETDDPESQRTEVCWPIQEK